MLVLILWIKYGYSQTQQTPNPIAQGPLETPPCILHSYVFMHTPAKIRTICYMQMTHSVLEHYLFSFHRSVCIHLRMELERSSILQQTDDILLLDNYGFFYKLLPSISGSAKVKYTFLQFSADNYE